MVPTDQVFDVGLTVNSLQRSGGQVKANNNQQGLPAWVFRIRGRCKERVATPPQLSTDLPSNACLGYDANDDDDDVLGPAQIRSNLNLLTPHDASRTTTPPIRQSATAGVTMVNFSAGAPSKPPAQSLALATPMTPDDRRCQRRVCD